MRFVVGITGASGVILSHHLVGALTSLGHDVELCISREACLTILEEMGPTFSTPQKFVASFTQEQQLLINLHLVTDLAAPIASGSYLVDGTIIVPCSMATLAAIACGLADNLLRRAADVTLKERRKLLIVPRETPLSEIHLENMLKLSRMGAIIIPPVPAWYLHPKSVEEMEHILVSRILDQLGVKAEVAPRWSGRG